MRKFWVKTVSYTHLDVYQRQILFRKLYEDNALGKLSDEQFAFLTSGYDEEKKTLTRRIAAVSYTHLDVYKRQVYLRTSATNLFTSALRSVALSVSCDSSAILRVSVFFSSS